jgi:GNAT superfamily N-acetyltransferase
MTMPELPRMATGVAVRPLAQEDLAAADHIFRVAFGTFMGVPDPAATFGDADYVRTRWAADPAAALGAYLEGGLVGSNFVTSWGSVGFFGPLTVRPELWDRGIAKRLLEPTMARFAEWGTRHAGLFTFAHSPKHLSLYQRFGFWPRFLTAIMAKRVEPSGRAAAPTRYSELPEPERAAAIVACRELTDAIFPGLDLAREICAVHAQRLGDTILLPDAVDLGGFAVCHWGAGSEAGSGACYVKFGAVRPGTDAPDRFGRLLDACEALAVSEGLARLTAGANMGRAAAYRQLSARGFRAELVGVAMERPNAPGYNRPEIYLIDDWR